MKTPLLYGIGVTFVMSALTLTSHLLGYWTDPKKLMMGMILGGISGLVVLVFGIVLGTRKARSEQGPADHFPTGTLTKTVS